MTDNVTAIVIEDLNTLLNTTKRKITNDSIAFENQWINLKEYYHGQGAEDAQGLVFQLQAWRDDYIALVERIEKMGGDYQTPVPGNEMEK